VKEDAGDGTRQIDGMYPVKIASKRKRKSGENKDDNKRGCQKLPYFFCLFT
jgi:hypothetical protein